MIIHQAPAAEQPDAPDETGQQVPGPNWTMVVPSVRSPMRWTRYSSSRRRRPSECAQAVCASRLRQIVPLSVEKRA